MNIIFLDIDGVLNIMSKSYNSCAYVNLAHDAVEPHLMKRLEHILEQVPDTKVVISSAWGLKQIKTVLEQKRFKYIDSIIDRTPRKGIDHRGDQIMQWIFENEPEFSISYVVLEDEPFDVCGDRCSTIPKEKVVHVDMNDGLKHSDIVKAIAILRGMQ